MTAQRANTPTLPELLSSLGYLPHKDQGRDLFYLSPFRLESTPTLHVDVKKDIWFDFHTCTGGNIVDLVRRILKQSERKHCRASALRFLQCRDGVTLPKTAFNHSASNGKTLKVTGVSRTIRHPDLIRYVTEERHIPLKLAKHYLSEVDITNSKTGGCFKALGMRNADGGYAVYNRYIRGAVGRPDVTVLRGKVSPPPEVHIFTSVFDMLSALADQGRNTFDGDMIILHSLSNLSNVFPYIDGYEHYQHLISWMDNDGAGEKATQLFNRIAQQQPALAFRKMNRTATRLRDDTMRRVYRHNPIIPS